MTISAASPSTKYLRYGVLWPLVPAMAMVMIDFTIVSISLTTIQHDLGLSSTAAQWTVTAYALATAAFVALGGRLGDIIGHRRIVTIGIVVFAGSSLLCGLVPDGSSLSEPWLIAFRALQGVGGALLIPSATVLVLNAFPPEERGKGLSIFFIVAGLFTAIGPIAGSYLTEYWTWRAIFWINVPVALLSLIELRRTKLDDEAHPAPIDVRGAVLLVAGMALTVLGIQQSTAWGWGSPATLGAVIAGVILLGVFWAVERRTANPLIDVRKMAANKVFAVDNAIVFLFFTAWLAIFVFGSMYFQISAGQAPAQAGFSILTVFYPFFVTSRIGGGLMDRTGPKLPVAIGLAVSAAGMALWAAESTGLDHVDVLPGQLVTGAGLGLVMSAVNTDSLNRVAPGARGEASGIVQTTRNFGSAVGVALLGTILLSVWKSDTIDSLTGAGVPSRIAGQVADTIVSGGGAPAGGGGGGRIAELVGQSIAQDFASGFQVAMYAGAGIMALAFVVALLWLPAGRQQAIA